MAIRQVSFKAGDVVIREGEDGDDLYAVASGSLTCTKIMEGKEGPTYLRDYNAGEAFGELALLYNAPRAATITAKTDVSLWALDRKTFNFIVKDSAQQKREKYDEFLQGVSILKSMEQYERNKLADAVREKWFEAGDYVIVEGQDGDVFFMVM